MFYPGGSSADITAVGFNWKQNYWCDLTGSLAKNGAVNSARPIALIALIGLYSGLYKNKLTKLLYYGMFCLGLILLNYFIYQTKILLPILPIIQKTTFGLFLLWIGMIDIYLYRISKLDIR